MFRSTAGVAVALVLGLSGCGGDEKKTSDSVDKNSADHSSQVGQTEKNTASTTPENFEIKLKDGNGTVSYYLKYDGENGKLLSGNKKEICRFKKSSGKFKIVVNDQTVGRIACYKSRYKIEDGAGKELMEYQKSGSDWKVKREETMLLRIKKRDYGFEAETPDDKRVVKVKEKDGKKSLRDANEKTILYTKDGLKSEAMIPLGFDSLDEKQRFALALAIQIGLGQ